MRQNKNPKRADPVLKPGALRFEPSGLVVDQPPEQFQLLRQCVVDAGKVLDLAHGMQHRGVIAAAETPPISARTRRHHLRQVHGDLPRLHDGACAG